MLANADYTFTLNVSVGCYPRKKPEKRWMIQYSPQLMTFSDFDELQHKGKAFCFNFKDVDESGLVTQYQKTTSGFDYTNIIFFDIDKMPREQDMETYIANLPFKPTFAYTTLSNGIETEYWKYNYRLLYALDEPVRSVQEFNAYYYAIAAANGFQQRIYPDGTKYEFDNRDVSQQYYGGGENSKSYRTDIIYSPDDFMYYLVDGEELRKQMTKRGSSKKRTTIPNEDNNIEKRGKAYNIRLEKPFYTNLFGMAPSEFLHEYDCWKYTYERGIETELTLSDDERYWIYPENYQKVNRKWEKVWDYERCRNRRMIVKWEIGSGRRKRMYVTAQIIKQNVPGISIEQLIYCLVRERYYYYDNSDNRLNNDFIIQTANNALSYTFELSPCKHPAISPNMDYWRLYGVRSATAASNIIKKEQKETQVLTYCDFNLSIKENLQILEEHGIKVSKSYLYALRKQVKEKETEPQESEETNVTTEYLEVRPAWLGKDWNNGDWLF